MIIQCIRFVVKLPYTTGAWKRRYCRGVGVDSIINTIRMFALDNDVKHFGYPYLMIQPRIAKNVETKVACFRGKAYYKVIW